jgi:hypothetical protein
MVISLNGVHELSAGRTIRRHYFFVNILLWIHLEAILTK